MARPACVSHSAATMQLPCLDCLSLQGAGSREPLQAANKKARGASSSSAGNILSFFGKGTASS